MSRLLHLRAIGALALAASLAACTRSEANPASRGASVATAATVTPAGAGMTPGLTDSVSTAADRGRIRGAESAPVWLVEISDFQCPFCKQWHDQSFAAIDRDYVQTGKVRLAYLNYPLSGMHPNARGAAEAAMCASVQGKFWELHESLFSQQERWAARPDPMPVFDSLATTAGVNPAAWRSCMRAHATAPLIDADHERSTRAGVGSTPSFFVGDQKIEGAMPLAMFRSALDSALARAATTKK